ncbi:hypothetical protein ESOMN_v1c05890 [Williamsoniiplasma somnilux]|uniref:HTH rpiR-type domain-containing protein n=1 Tax=Williamsoniiplasma somnilux TaxID=215578 RepID=A0A2K8P1U0_9MOLU|nr:hypothetical protein [Williamsoniiplasma somnilux]ATZ18971.1 hypothetical protein ESOMN_v1c05890 [Williamsoniiplasma somnilux]
MTLRNKLLAIVQTSSNQVKVSISNVLLRSYDDGGKYTISELSIMSYTSKSSITKFAINLGYKGYKELQFVLENDIANFNQNFEFNNEKNMFDETWDSIKEFTINMVSYIEIFKDDLIKINEHIKNKKINLIWSYSLEQSIKIFAGILKQKGYYTNYSPINNTNFSINIDARDELFLIFVSGTDNERIFNLFKKINDKNITYLFLTHSVSNSFLKPKPNFKMNIDFENESLGYTKRQLFLSYLITQISKNIK